MPFLHVLQPLFPKHRASQRRFERLAPYATAISWALCGSLAQAQTWSDERTTPSLSELVSVDQTGEPNWLFGSEDVAGDSLGSFGAAEQASDVRSAYAATDRNRLWLRTYVSSEAAPTGLALYVFIDTDRDASTGGSANAPELDPLFDADPSPGGYEIVIEIQDSERLENVWRWSEANQEFEALSGLDGFDAAIEAGADLDPLRLGSPPNGYLQAALNLARLEVAVSCDVNFLFRSNAGMGLADIDVGAAGPCVPGDSNDNGVADVAESNAACETDDQCPAEGSCREGRCVAPEYALGVGEVVQGGAFTCETVPWQAPYRARGLCLLGLALVLGLRRKARREAQQGSVGS